MARVFRSPHKRMVPSPAFGNRLTIDWSHPLTNGLIGCWLPGFTRALAPTVATVIDLTGNCDLNSNQNTGLLADNSTSVAQEGVAGGRPTPDNVLSPVWQATLPAKYKALSSLSIYYRGDRNGVNSSTATIPYLIFLSYDDGLISPYTFAGLGDGSSQDLTDVQLQWNDGAGTTKGSSANTDFNQAGTISALGTFKPGGNAILYKNGVLANSTAYGAGAATVGTTPILGINGWGFSGGGGRLSPTFCYLACLWNRELSADEAALIDADPYAFIVPAEAEMPAIVAAAAATTQYAAFSTPQHSLSQVINRMIGY